MPILQQFALEPQHCRTEHGRQKAAQLLVYHSEDSAAAHTQFVPLLHSCLTPSISSSSALPPPLYNSFSLSHVHLLSPCSQAP